MERNESTAEPSRPAATLTLAGTLAGARGILPFAVLVVPLGMAFGVAASQKGFSAAEAVLMSTLICGAAVQFAAIDLWAQSLPFVAIVGVTLAINARNILYSASLYPWLRSLSWPRRLPMLAVLSDMSWAYGMGMWTAGARDAGQLLGAGGTLWLVWIVATGLGARFGAAIADPRALGFDVTLAAFFVASLAGMWRGPRDLLPWLAAGAGAIAGYWLLPAGWPIIAGALTGALAGTVRDAR
jgi:4-azaleucine resistance transporter AzlC